MDFNEFTEIVCRKREPRKIKITGSWGIYDAYKLLRKNHWFNIGRPLKEHEFYMMIRMINSLLADEISMGHTVKFPAKMGKLELRKFKIDGAKIDKNGKLKITYPVDFGKTVKLWYEDEEAYKSKTLVWIETKWIYYVKYKKFDANYNNKHFYQFELNRFVKRNLRKNINSGKTDSLW